jgi:hypothetical protein
MMLNI